MSAVHVVLIGSVAWLTAVVAPAQVAAVVDTIDGRHLQGAVVVNEHGRVAVTTAAGVIELDLAEVSALTPTAAEKPAVRVIAPHRVWLRSGAQLSCSEIGIASGQAGAAFAAQLPSGARITVPMTMVQAVRHVGATRPEPALFAQDLREPETNSDLLYVVSQDRAQRSSVRITGLQASADSAMVAFDLRGKSYEFGFDGVAAIVFGKNTGFAPDRQSKPRTVVDLTTGEHLEGRLLALDQQLRLRLDEGAEVVVPTSKLLRMAIASDRLVRLSELTPAVAQTPALDRVWPWTTDRSVGGPGFRLAGKQYDRGIGMVPRTRLTYDLGGRFDVFEATVGIDERGGPAADAVFRIFVDEHLAWEERFNRQSAPRQVALELHRCQQLALEVDFGSNYDLGDHCVFADARVVQK